MAENEYTIYTIGHSNHPTEKFLGLLGLHSIQTVADVRSHPRSRYSQFRQKALEALLCKEGIEYLYLGQELGGHPDSDEMYDKRGRVIYERLAATSAFRSGIRHVGELTAKTRLVLMCTEWDPAKCHRHPLLARVLLERDFEVLHILRDGSLREASAMFDQPVDPQIPLIEPPGEDRSWQSPKRIR